MMITIMMITLVMIDNHHDHHHNHHDGDDYTNCDIAKVTMMMMTMTTAMMTTMMMMMTTAMMMVMLITAGLDTGTGLCNIHSPSQQLTGINKGILTNFDEDDLVSLLAPTGALIVTVVYYTYVYLRSATF